MPAYFFDKLVGLVGDEFDMEFKSMKEMYDKDQGDPVERLREMAQEERDANLLLYYLEQVEQED